MSELKESSNSSIVSQPSREALREFAREAGRSAFALDHHEHAIHTISRGLFEGFACWERDSALAYIGSIMGPEWIGSEVALSVTWEFGETLLSIMNAEYMERAREIVAEREEEQKRDRAAAQHAERTMVTALSVAMRRADEIAETRALTRGVQMRNLAEAQLDAANCRIIVESFDLSEANIQGDIKKESRWSMLERLRGDLEENTIARAAACKRLDACEARVRKLVEALDAVTGKGGAR